MGEDRWSRVEACFHAAQELPTHERDEFLAKACAGEPEVRREVESLLAHEGHADELLESPAWKHVTPSSNETRALVVIEGALLADYRIAGKLGAGGMGEVYRATDTKLHREVALKVLAADFAHDSAWLSRFQREACVLASLNHPHIAAIYGLEESNGVLAIAMELVEGPTLAQRMARGRIPIAEALPIAQQIAEALEYAHEKGIVHRDLKPANVKLRADGVVKVLDFGLAKAARVGDKPEVTATGEGVILGTPAYMSPEQATGLAVDRRADIWAFGVVLFEMLAGRQIYARKTTLETLAAVARDEPTWDELPADTPVGIAGLLRRCLDRNVKNRLRDIGEARVAIDAGSGPEVPRPADGRSPRRWTFVWGAALLIAAITAFAGWMLKPAPVRPVSRMEIALGHDEHFANLDTPVLAISPDGSKIVYVARRGEGPPQLFLRPLDALKAEPIAGTESAASPFFSPDGQWIAFFTGSKLKKVPVGGGVAMTLCDAGGTLSTRGGAWGANNTILLQATSGAFLEITASGGTPHRLPASVKHAFWRWPELTPGGGAVLFAGGAAGTALASSTSIAAATLDATGPEKDLIAGGSAPRLAATGDLIYVRNGTLVAVPFNSRHLELSGSPTPVLEGVRESTMGAAQYSLSESGTLVYVPGGLQGNVSRLVWVDRAGKEQPIPAPPRVYDFPRLSPDGRRIAVTISETTDTQVWLYDTARDALSRATFEGVLNTPGAWSPDSKRLAIMSDREGSSNVYVQPADGGGAAERLTTSRFQTLPTSWSPDGQTLVFTENNPVTEYDIWTVGLGDRKPRLFLKTHYNEAAPKFSPDGHWLAYTSDESGRWEVYVQPYPGPGGKWQISTEGGTEPVWNPSGRELFYRAGNRIMAVAVNLQHGFLAGKPVVLFEGPWLSTRGALQQYDVSPDGKRFLMLKAAEEDQGAQKIIVIQNWLEELKRRMAAGKK